MMPLSREHPPPYSILHDSSHGSSHFAPDSHGVVSGPGNFRDFALHEKYASQAHYDLQNFRTVDFSKTNEERHNWQRIDTLQTPYGHSSRFVAQLASDVGRGAEQYSEAPMRKSPSASRSPQNTPRRSRSQSLTQRNVDRRIFTDYITETKAVETIRAEFRRGIEELASAQERGDMQPLEQVQNDLRADLSKQLGLMRSDLMQASKECFSMALAELRVAFEASRKSEGQCAQSLANILEGQSVMRSAIEKSKSEVLVAVDQLKPPDVPKMAPETLGDLRATVDKAVADVQVEIVTVRRQCDALSVAVSADQRIIETVISGTSKLDDEIRNSRLDVGALLNDIQRIHREEVVNINIHREEVVKIVNAVSADLLPKFHSALAEAVASHATAADVEVVAKEVTRLNERSLDVDISSLATQLESKMSPMIEASICKVDVTDQMASVLRDTIVNVDYDRFGQVLREHAPASINEPVLAQVDELPKSVVASELAPTMLEAIQSADLPGQVCSVLGSQALNVDLEAVRKIVAEHSTKINVPMLLEEIRHIHRRQPANVDFSGLLQSLREMLGGQNQKAEKQALNSSSSRESFCLVLDRPGQGQTMEFSLSPGEELRVSETGGQADYGCSLRNVASSRQHRMPIAPPPRPSSAPSRRPQIYTSVR